VATEPGLSQMPPDSVRPPAVAGRFYPGEPGRLRAAVSRLLGAQPGVATQAPQAVIAPHAGYVYSGAVAGAAFAALRRATPAIDRVVLIGPAHYVAVDGIAVPTATAFATPLGPVAVDRDAVDALADLPFVRRSDAAHAPEHALEVELPFLQAVAASVPIVPLLVGETELDEVAIVLRRLWDIPGTLIVVSSDLSHYHAYETARRLDAETAEAIEHGDGTGLGPGQACGFRAVGGLLREVARRGLARRRIALTNSGDTAGPRDRVVGYGAWVFG